MDEEPHTKRDDISALDEQDQSKWTETIKNVKSSRLDQDHSIITSDLSSDVGGRVRLYSESQVHTVSRWEDEWQDGILVEEGGGGGDGAPFRGRSQSAPAALWKAKKYGRQLRRMSDEFDTWLDKGEFRRAKSARNVPQKQTSRGWFSFLWGSQEEEGRE